MLKKIKIYCNFDLSFDLDHEKQIELYIDMVPTTMSEPGVIRFALLIEPPEILDLSQQSIDALESGLCDHILTHNSELLSLGGNIHLFEFGTSWIGDYNFPKKDFKVSTLVGGKLLAPGHQLRQKLWFKENKISIPKNFFLSSSFGGIENYNNNPVLGKDKSPLFDSQFHICIENVKRENWFTEKLIDCMITKTIPIYYGCPNIGDWFDIRGIIVVSNLQEIIEACNNLDKNTYNNMLPYIEGNYNISKEFTDIGSRIKRDILKLL
jgi:hypothetical protein